LLEKEQPTQRRHPMKREQTMKTMLWRLARKTLVGLACVLAPAATFAQGTVNMRNFVTGSIDAPFFDEQGIRLKGSNYVAQLYFWSTWGPDIGFKAAGSPVPFATYTPGNFFGTNGYFLGSGVELPGVPGRTPAWVQVRAWEVAGGSSFEEAALAGAWTGQSKILLIPIVGDPYSGGVPSVPAYMLGLEYPGEPLVVRQPQSRRILREQSATLSVVASTGVAGFYQWYKKPTNQPAVLIPGATNTTYTTAPLFTNTLFWVSITSTVGSTNSVPAAITVLPSAPRLGLERLAGLPWLSLDGAVGFDYRIDYATNLDAPAWTPLLELELGTTPFRFTDSAASNAPVRFYRAVAP
jgi:hypothetical protein